MILVEDQRTVHVNIVNNNRNIVTIHPGDLVIARTIVISDKANNKSSHTLLYNTRYIPNCSWHMSWRLYYSEIKQAK